MNTRTKILAATIAAVAVTGGVGASVATADTPSPAPSTPTTSAPKVAPQAGAKKHRTVWQRALHGEATMGGKLHRVVDFQRGTVEKVSATSITVKSNDGFTATYTVSPTTKVRKDKAAATVADVQAQDKVRVVATKVASTVTARVIVDHTK